MLLAAREIVENGKPLAAEELESAQADIEFAEGRYRIKGTDRAIEITALAKMHPGKLDLDYRERPKVPSTFPNGCHVAEVEIEPETGSIEIVSYVAVDDAGTIVNHQIVEGQMQGGITQGAGHVLGEQAVYDESGQLLSGSFMDYPMPRAVLVENLRVLEFPVPTATNPLGAKGVGEAGVTGSMPCIMNAVLDALRQGGVTHFDMPATPQRIWAALRAAKRGERAAFAVPQP
jgi:carbon-monoxide dehydrogenase large subunit